MTLAAGSPLAMAAPTLRRRLACFCYEGVLLFGVLVPAAYLYSSLTQQRHALSGLAGLQFFLFLVLGIYFVWFWARGGQTLAMKTWRIRLAAADGRAVSQARAMLRYLCSWIWFVPALAAVHLAGVRSAIIMFAALAVGVLGYAASALLTPGRQFPHDLLCGTRLQAWPPDATV